MFLLLTSSPFPSFKSGVWNRGFLKTDNRFKIIAWNVWDVWAITKVVCRNLRKNVNSVIDTNLVKTRFGKKAMQTLNSKEEWKWVSCHPVSSTRRMFMLQLKIYFSQFLFFLSLKFITLPKNNKKIDCNIYSRVSTLLQACTENSDLLIGRRVQDNVRLSSSFQTKFARLISTTTYHTKLIRNVYLCAVVSNKKELNSLGSSKWISSISVLKKVPLSGEASPYRPL